MDTVRRPGGPGHARLVAAARPARPTTALLVEARILDWEPRLRRGLASAARPTWPFEYRLVRDLVRRRARAARPRVRRHGARWQALIALLDQPDSPWWDDATDDGRRRDPRRDRRPRRSTRPARELRAALRRPGELDVGPAPPGEFEEATLGSSGIGPLEWYFNKGPFAGGRRRRRDRQHLLPAVAGLPGPGRPAYVAGSASTDVFAVTNAAVVPADDRHERPRRRADHHHDRPERQPVRPPLRRPDQRGRGRHGAAPFSPTASQRALRPDARRWSRSRRARFYSLTGSGPSGTSIRTRPSSITTG